LKPVEVRKAITKLIREKEARRAAEVEAKLQRRHERRKPLSAYDALFVGSEEQGGGGGSKGKDDDPEGAMHMGVAGVGQNVEIGERSAGGAGAAAVVARKKEPKKEPVAQSGANDAGAGGQRGEGRGEASVGGGGGGRKGGGSWPLASARSVTKELETSVLFKSSSFLKKIRGMALPVLSAPGA